MKGENKYAFSDHFPYPWDCGASELMLMWFYGLLIVQLIVFDDATRPLLVLFSLQPRSYEVLMMRDFPESERPELLLILLASTAPWIPAPRPNPLTNHTGWESSGPGQSLNKLVSFEMVKVMRYWWWEIFQLSEWPELLLILLAATVPWINAPRPNPLTNHTGWVSFGPKQSLDGLVSLSCAYSRSRVLIEIPWSKALLHQRPMEKLRKNLQGIFLILWVDWNGQINLLSHPILTTDITPTSLVKLMDRIKYNYHWWLITDAWKN